MLAFRTSKISQIISILITALLVSIPAQAKYSGGIGEPNNPYQIATYQDLIDLGNEPNDYDKHFILTADIDLNPTLPNRKIFDKAVVGSFTGVFDGNGSTISNLTIVGGASVGLFGCLKSGSEIKNLGLVDVNIQGSGGFNGGLVGQNEGNVVHCSATGTVTDAGACSSGVAVGGLIGDNKGWVAYCSATGVVNGKGHVGGLIGDNEGSAVYCSSNSTVNCENVGAGGLAGFNLGTLTRCYSHGTVSGSYFIGGLVGRNYGGIIAYCYSNSTVSAPAHVGGLVGNNYGSITHCYSTGVCTGGGLIGTNYSHQGNVVQCFWDTQTSGCASSDGGVGLSTTEMKDIQTYLNAGWDFIGDERTGTSETWQMPEDGGYPLIANFNNYLHNQLQGQGTAEQPYLISVPQDLGAMLYYSPCSNYQLIASIDISGTHWPIAVLPWFGGHFDGDGHTITSLNVNGGGYIGFFGQLASGAEVKNLALTNVNIVASGECAGGLVAANMGTIAQCCNTGAVSGQSWIGGLVGENEGCTINCYSDVAVTCNNPSGGGLVGRNRDSVVFCYSTGSVNGCPGTGGLVGEGNSAASSFWDTQTSTRTTSAAGKGRTTVQMKQASNYIGWNSSDQIIWTIDEERDYPHLTWEGKTGLAIPSSSLADSLAGSGTETDPYLIEKAEQFNLIGLYPCEWDKHFRLMSDIDLQQITEYNVIGIGTNSAFAGSFEGNGHTISHLTITGGGCLGVFGCVGSAAQVSYLGVLDISVNGSGDYAGGLVGDNAGTLAQCYTTGVLVGEDYLGGLVGWNWNSGTISQCYSGCAINGSIQVGGLVGYNLGAINQCYSTGSVSGSSGVGGLVADNFSGGTVRQCYSTGAVNGGSKNVGGLVGYNFGLTIEGLSAVTTSFWDMETSEQQYSAGGIGKTKDEMQIQNTFTDAGWDFIGETNNGQEDIWWINEGVDYPRLWWELSTED